jgi:methionyl-tRNA formyltransferase
MTLKHANIAFFGTPDLAVYVLEELEHAGILPGVVVTPPDKPAGRNLVLTPPAVKVWAESRDIPVLQPESLKDKDSMPEFTNTDWDLFIVAAYNYILPSWILSLPKHQVLNVHPSLLPKLRGPSPIRSALLLDQQDAVGVSIITLDTQVDHGPLVAQATVELPVWPVRGHILDELLFREGGKLLSEVIPLWLKGEITPDIQNHTEATFTKKFEKGDGEIDLSGDPHQNYLRFCAVDGWPGAFFFLQDSRDPEKRIRVKITDATVIDGVFKIISVIPEGKREMPWDVYLQSRGDSAI